MSDESTKQQVVGIIGELFAEVQKTSGAIDTSALIFWTNRYSLPFEQAIDVKKRKYEGDKDMLMRKARALAAEARARAGSGPITADHARQASEKVDCRPPAPDEPHTFEDWCY